MAQAMLHSYLFGHNSITLRLFYIRLLSSDSVLRSFILAGE